MKVVKILVKILVFNRIKNHLIFKVLKRDLLINVVLKITLKLYKVKNKYLLKTMYLIQIKIFQNTLLKKLQI